MCGCCKFESSAHYRPVHRGDYGQSAVLNKIECAVPVTGNFERFVDVPFLVLRQIQPGAEMIPARPEYDGQRFLWGIAEKPVDIFDQRFIDCITFFGSVKRQNGDLAAHFEVDQIRRKSSHRVGSAMGWTGSVTPL